MNKSGGYKKEMLIYLVALIERLTHKEISQSLNLTDVYVSISIKRIVEIMIKNKNVMDERDTIITLIQN